MIAYLQELLQLRKSYPILHRSKPYQMMDYENRGYPDLSYHGEDGWQVDFERNRGFIGMFYCGAYGGKEHLYLAYNFQNESQKMALPREISWSIVFDTGSEKQKKSKVTGEIEVAENTILLLTGKERTGKEKADKNGKKQNRN